MNNEQAIKIITNEMLCIKTANVCDRDCGDCPFVMKDVDILEAYELAIEALKGGACMTVEGLKAEADKLGYKVVRKARYERLLPCSCGCNRRERWYTATGEIDLKCAKCGKTIRGKNLTDAMRKWNQEVIGGAVK